MSCIPFLTSPSTSPQTTSPTAILRDEGLHMPVLMPSSSEGPITFSAVPNHSLWATLLVLKGSANTRQKPTSPPADAVWSVTTVLPDLLPSPRAQPEGWARQGQFGTGRCQSMEQRSKIQVSQGKLILLPACNSFLEMSNEWSKGHISGGKAGPGQLRGWFTPFPHQNFT